MTVRLYRSTDVGAPVLTGQTGSLVALLDACLVNGYGSVAAAGWTKAFSATNKAAYKQNLTGSNNVLGMYLYVDDTGPGAGSSREARCCGFETMSAITPTGTGQFPTAAQIAITGGFVAIRKSATADATGRAWTLVANGQTFYLFTECGDSISPLGAATFFFGDIKPYKSADPYAVMIMGRITENSSTGQNDPMQNVGHITPTSFNLNQKYFGHFMPRTWTGLGGSIQVGKTFDLMKMDRRQRRRGCDYGPERRRIWQDISRAERSGRRALALACLCVPQLLVSRLHARSLGTPSGSAVDPWRYAHDC
jgi:hypothetical protein